MNVADGSIVPVLMGSNLLASGVYTLLVDIVKYLPSPEKRSCTGINAKTNEVYNADYDFAKPKSAYVWKTIADPFIGKYSLIKVNSGVLKADDVLFNHHKDVEEKIGKLYVMRGNKPEEVKELHAGDIGALAKLSSARRPIHFPQKQTRFCIFERQSPHHIPIRDIRRRTREMRIRSRRRCKS